MRRSRKARPKTPAARKFANQPFRTLARQRVQSPPQPRPPEQPASAPAPEDDFARAMAGVRPIDPHRAPSLPSPRPRHVSRPIADSDAEAMAELSDLVTGAGTFDIANTAEMIEAAASGVDRRLVRRLRRGDFSYRRHLDLHRMTVDEARSAVDAFLKRAAHDGQRCVLVVHGRGLSSPGKIPVLKKELVAWLSRGRWARHILAFASARACDGGTGALYVLLRRKRGTKKSVEITEGAKW